MKKKKQIKKGSKFWYCPERRLWVLNSKKTPEEVRREYSVEVVEKSTKIDSLRTDKLNKL